MTWKFDSTIASTFVDHARQHIPNYDQVIDKSVSVCEYYLSKTSSIIDVGCATGQTLRQLNQAGFTNLTGVESSQDMLKYCDHSTARILHSSNFPAESFDGVICNWTLHFIKNKLEYLKDIYQSLPKGGILILSEKTSLDPLLISLYHQWKSQQGVAEEDIKSKEFAVKDIMYVDNIEWYLHFLKIIGFRKISIIDASWCFTTFFCVK